MATTHLSLVQSQAPLPSDNSSPKNNKVSSCIQPILVGLGVIILIGSLVSSGFLYPQVGGWFLAACGGGLIGGLVLIAIGLCCSGATSTQEKPNMRSGSLANTGEIADTKGLTQSPNRPRVPRRASDIELPETLPDILSPFSGDNWVEEHDLNLYIGYLATEYSDLFSPCPWRLSWHNVERPCIGNLKKYIFHYYPSWFANFNHLNLPIPLFVDGNHWTLVYIDRGKRTVEYYDSKKKYGNHREIVQELTKISKKLSEQEPDKPPYRFICKIKKVLQPDDYQCGSWVLFFLEYRLIDPKFDFNQLRTAEAQELIKKYRIKITLKLTDHVQRAAVIYKKESRDYLEYYKDQKVADNILQQDCNTWEALHDGTSPFKGRPLIPFQTEELAAIREQESKNYLEHYKDQKVADEKLHLNLCSFLTSSDRNNPLKGRPLIPVETKDGYRLTTY